SEYVCRNFPARFDHFRSTGALEQNGSSAIVDVKPASQACKSIQNSQIKRYADFVCTSAGENARKSSWPKLDDAVACQPWDRVGVAERQPVATRYEVREASGLRLA